MNGGGDTTQPNVACLPAHVAESIPTLPEVEELTEEEDSDSDDFGMNIVGVTSSKRR